uniref:DDE Tnp4 domain-containing protein n=1 Tax=Amphimedon queenslandica TaxID=400682 RepID=A0A1X7VJ28_AMPQE
MAVISFGGESYLVTLPRYKYWFQGQKLRGRLRQNSMNTLDGKHVNKTPHPNSGSWYYNNKQRFSIVLLAVLDAHFKLVYIDIGYKGRDIKWGSLSREHIMKCIEQ